MNNASMPSTAVPLEADVVRAKHLCIRVIRNGETKVEVSLPRRTIDWLETLIPPDTLESIKRRGIDIPAIKAEVQDRGYTAGPVFQLEEGEKTVTVYLK